MKQRKYLKPNLLKMKTNYFTLLLVATLGVATIFTSCKKTKDETEPVTTTTTGKTITITDDGNGIGTQKWTKNNTYLLDGFCFVNSGQTLTIEPGTVVKGKPGQGESASALIIAQGGKIMAEGTAAEPIIFTAEADNLDGNIDANARGLWGGLILLGNATINAIPSTQQVEGIPTTEPRGAFGGTNDADNSGVIKYVSIRHGGTDIGAGNEINGLTLGAVGSGTIIDYVEIVANADDGIEFFGGAANVKHALIVDCGDDSFDWDMGYHGKGQFWLSLQSDDSDRNGEHDGGTDPETGTPYTLTKVYNATYIGHEQSQNIIFRDNSGGFYYNSIFVNCGEGIEVEYLASGADSYKQFQDGNLKIENNIFYNIAGQTDGTNATLFMKSSADGGAAQDTILAQYFTAHNTVVDPGVSKSNPIPTNPQTAGQAYPSNDSWYDAVNYAGAIGTTNWAQGWTITFE